MPKKIDLTNKQFGYWTVIREATKEEKNNRPGAFWLCKCQCGTEKIVSGQTLRNNESKSCGCKTIQYISEKNKNKAEDLTGQHFGKLTVIKRDFEKEKNTPKRGSTYWYCQCECGNNVSVLKSSLIKGTTQSCGCFRKEKAAKMLAIRSKNNYIDELNNKYGKLTVIEKIENNKQGVYWKCQCDCGNVIIVSGASLRSGNTSSCGCIGKSKGEYKIEQILLANNINFIKEYPIIVNNHKYRFDFAILENNVLKYFIEYDGKQHFEPCELFGGEEYFKYIQNNDFIKNNYCKDNNIPLIRIPYTKYNSLELQDLMI